MPYTVFASFTKMLVIHHNIKKMKILNKLQIINRKDWAHPRPCHLLLHPRLKLKRHSLTICQATREHQELEENTGKTLGESALSSYFTNLPRTKNFLNFNFVTLEKLNNICVSVFHITQVVWFRTLRVVRISELQLGVSAIRTLRKKNVPNICPAFHHNLKVDLCQNGSRIQSWYILQ